MKLYNYLFRANYTNASITITVRTDEGEVVANQVALEELATALAIPAELWDAEELEVEDY